MNTSSATSPWQRGKDGGTFYTPATVVRYMVEVLDPQPGDKKFLDPACGSGGMFVQAARYMHAHNANEAEQMKFRCYGVEKEPDTVKLAKMNLLLNNVRGDITEANSSLPDPTTLSAPSITSWQIRRSTWTRSPLTVSAVMRASIPTAFPATPPSRRKKPPTRKKRFPTPTTCGSATFATALNEHGKAALVMANPLPTQARASMRFEKMIEEGIISQMVTLPSNMFSSVTLPATLWFFDKHKPQTDKRTRSCSSTPATFSRRWIEPTGSSATSRSKTWESSPACIMGILLPLSHFLWSIGRHWRLLRKLLRIRKTKTKAYWQAQIDWLTERFPDGEYRDVIGLCKAAKLDGEDGIIDQDYSLNAGRYVGVVIEDDGMTEADFKETMLGLNAEFEALNEEAKKLEAQISLNLRGLFTNE